MTEKMGLREKKIVVIGCGNMGNEVVKSLIESRVPRKNIEISEKSEKRRLELGKIYSYADYSYVSVYFDNKGATEWADIIILAVKPHQLEDVLKEIAPEVTNDKLLVSIAAGVRLEQIEKWLKAGKIQDYEKVFRVMPNMFMRVKQGMIEICRDAPFKKQHRAEDLDIVKQIFSAGGRVIIIDEKDIDGYSAGNGSIPAYLAELAEAFIDADVEQGIPVPEAYKSVAQNFRAIAAYLDAGGNLRDLKEVTQSPNGSTVQGMNLWRRSGCSGTIMEVIKVARYGAAGLGQKE